MELRRVFLLIRIFAIKYEGTESSSRLHGVLGHYDQLPERSFDYEVLEHTRCAVVIPYIGVWADIGSWDALVPHLQGTVIGEGSISEDSKGTHLINELSCPVHIIGAPGLIVAVPDGILVADRAGKTN